ncbi:MAG: thiol peroxidase [Defluviitaleaceae bacterium]|nr:thiol peroxidase [Defluviitaleaceae bacterium]
MNLTFNGNPITLEGQQLQVNDTLKNFTVSTNTLTKMSLADTGGVRIFLSVPSLDTPVCSTEVNTFNKRASEIPGVTLYIVSMDLPFAQNRFCDANKIENVVTLSDHIERGFARATGTYIKEMGLLSRSVFVLDPNNKVVYVEYVQELTEHPNYDAVISAAKDIS